MDSLGVSCYNAGTDGMCIYYHYAILSAMIQRGAIPKMVLLEVMPSDIEITTGATFTLDATLDYLSPHYGEYPQIDSLFALNGWEEHMKMLSKTYQYKSKLVQLIKCNYIPLPEDKGYEALIGSKVTSSEPGVIDIEKNEWDDADISKIGYFLKFIELCADNKIQLVLFYSPYYHVQPSGAIEYAKQIAIDHGIPFWDYSIVDDFQKAELFYDDCHLNDTGARLYSTEIVNELKNIYNK